LLKKLELHLKSEDDHNVKLSDMAILKTGPQRGKQINKYKNVMEFTAIVGQRQTKFSFHVSNSSKKSHHKETGER
jgi:hypothetical protein